MDNIVGLVTFVIVSSGFVGLGLYILRNLDSATVFFEARGASLYGRRVTSRIYKRAYIRIGAIAFTVLGSVFVIVALTRLGVSVLALVGS